jgi:hypothetical protein
MNLTLSAHRVFAESQALLLNLILPRINDYMTTAVVEAIYPREGDGLEMGAKLFDLTVDLSSAAPHDCPPISHYRLVLRERAWLRRLFTARLGEPVVGDPLAIFSTAPDEPLEAAPSRQARLAVAAILHQSAWGLI